MGINPDRADVASRFRRGADHPRWKGGRHIDERGYVKLFRSALSPEDQALLGDLRATHVREHRLVMARKLGRPLERWEDVHHINGDKTDNRPENLRLFGSRSEHVRHMHFDVCPHCGKSLR